MPTGDGKLRQTADLAWCSVLGGLTGDGARFGHSACVRDDEPRPYVYMFCGAPIEHRGSVARSVRSSTRDMSTATRTGGAPERRSYVRLPDPGVLGDVRPYFASRLGSTLIS